MTFNSNQTELFVSGMFDNNLNFGDHIVSTGQYSNFFLAKLQNIITAMPEVLEESTLMIYPNPTSDIVYFTLPENQAVTPAKVELYDVIGKLVHTTVLERNNQPFSIGQLNQGIYLVTVTAQDGVRYQEKLVVE